YIDRANAHVAKDQIAAAIDDCTKAIWLDQKSPVGFRLRGELLAKSRKLAAAAKDFGQAYDLAPDDLDLAQNWCYTLLGSGDVARCQAVGTQLRQRFATSEDPHQVLVLCRILILRPERDFDTDQLVQLSRKAVSLDPQSWWPLHVLAGAYIRNGR